MKENQNEFGENISDKELTDLAKRIRKLSDEKIDELWYLCEYIYTEREEKFKAMAQKYVNRIKESLNSAKIVVGNLWDETKIKDIRKNLSIVENY